MKSAAARIGAASGEELGHVALIEPRIPSNLRLGSALHPPDPLTVLLKSLGEAFPINWLNTATAAWPRTALIRLALRYLPL